MRIILTFPAIFDGLNKYNEILFKIAVKEQVGWVDNANLIPHEDQYFVDRVHFSKAGAKRMAENIAPVIEKILNRSNIPGHTSDPITSIPPCEGRRYSSLNLLDF